MAQSTKQLTPKGVNRAANKVQRIADTLAQLDNMSESVKVDLAVAFAAHGVSRATGWRYIDKGIIPAPSKAYGKCHITVGDLRRSLTK